MEGFTYEKLNQLSYRLTEKEIYKKQNKMDYRKPNYTDALR